MVQAAPGEDFPGGVVIPLRPAVPDAPAPVPAAPPVGSGLVRWVGRRTRLLGRAAAMTTSAAAVPLVGTGRLAGVVWRWIRADDYATARRDQPEFVERVRTRRRRQAWLIAGPYLTAAAGGWLLWHPMAPILAAGAVVTAGGVVETRRRLARRATPLRIPGMGRGTPQDSAVVRAAIAAKLATAPVEETRLASPVVVEPDGGWSTVLRLPPGQRARKAIGKEADFASALGVGESRVFFEPVDDHAGHLSVYVAKEDPFLKVYPHPLIGRTDPVDFWAGIPAGVNGRGRRETLRLVDASLLVAGEPRAGKSAAVNGIVAAAALAVTTKIHLWDGKGAGDHRPWRKIAHTAEKRNAAGLLEHLKAMQAQMERVFDMLDDAGGSTKLTPELCRKFGVDVELTIVDETRYYVSSPLGEEIVAAMVDIASRGPAAGVLLVLATQRMTTDAIPGPLKGVCSLRWAMRCPDSTASNAVLGPGAVGRGYDASEIPRRTHRGVGILDADGAEPVKLRSYFLDDTGTDLSDIAAAAYELRRAAGTLPEREMPDQVMRHAMVQAAFGVDDKLTTDELADRLGWTRDRLTAELDGVPVRQLWRDGKNAGRGYHRADVDARTDR